MAPDASSRRRARNWRLSSERRVVAEVFVDGHVHLTADEVHDLATKRLPEGAHLWMFFEQPLPATHARRLGSAILTRAVDRRHQLGLDSYDRLFPNQDTLPKGGFGNLTALPLQRRARAQHNTEFLDRDLTPFEDQ